MLTCVVMCLVVQADLLPDLPYKLLSVWKKGYYKLFQYCFKSHAFNVVNTATWVPAIIFIHVHNFCHNIPGHRLKLASYFLQKLPSKHMYFGQDWELSVKRDISWLSLKNDK